MALFTDGDISTLPDLQDQETGILDAASAEGVDLSTKMRLAQEEIGIEVMAFLLENGQSVCSEAAIRQLTHVAVTLPLKQWHTFHALALMYRDLYYNHYNDRYGEKWKEYQRLATASAKLLFETGVGIVYTPVERAGKPTLSWATGTMGANTYYVRVSWVSGAGSEGAPSETATLSTEDGTNVMVTPPSVPSVAASWNVYAGTAIDRIMRQNETPLAPGAAWTMPGTGLLTSDIAGDGQDPDVYVTLRRTFRRG
jgi:hypothetical protein